MSACRRRFDCGDTGPLEITGASLAPFRPAERSVWRWGCEAVGRKGARDLRGGELAWVVGGEAGSRERGVGCVEGVAARRWGMPPSLWGTGILRLTLSVMWGRGLSRRVRGNHEKWNRVESSHTVPLEGGGAGAPPPPGVATGLTAQTPPPGQLTDRPDPTRRCGTTRTGHETPPRPTGGPPARPPDMPLRERARAGGARAGPTGPQAGAKRRAPA